MKYFKFDHDLSAFDVTDKYDYVRLPYEDVGGKKVLFILDMVPSEDLKSGRLLSGCTGDLLQSLRNHAQKTFGRSKYSWCAVTFNAFRTFGKSQEFQEQARDFFAERIRAMILRYKPDYVVSFGAHVMNALIPKKIVQDGKGRTRYSYWLGVPIETSAVYDGSKHRFTYVPNLSLNDVVTGSSTEASMLGYMVKCLSPIYGKVYAVDVEKLNNHKSVVISSYDEYKSLMRKVRRAPVVAIDTEADNLNKIVNRLLTVQFAVDEGTGFLLPMHHKDTPFTPKELTNIASDLRSYFEGDNENDYHIYANGKFDLTLFRTSLDVRYFANDVWDIFGGEFALDENLKGLDVFLGEYYYSLGNLSVQYGFTGYLNAEFGKQHRANFGEADLSDGPVVRYCLSGDNYVSTEFGPKPIADVQVGDLVYSFNHETASVELQPVTMISHHETEETMFELDYGDGLIRLTENHEVWSVTRQAYVKVRDLTEDEDILLEEFENLAS